MTADTENIKEIFTFSPSDSSLLNAYSLVLSSANIPHTINCNQDNTIELVIAAPHRERALYEIASYLQENKNWPPPVPVAPSYNPSFKAMSFIVIGGIVLIYSISGDWHPESIWFKKGAGDSTAILQGGEYYRLITPLMLHADLVHLMGNSFLGGFLLHFYFKIMGNGLGLFTMLATATLANYVNVLAHGSGHHFVGFSTAVFSVVGVLCTSSYQKSTSTINFHLFMPVMAGLALLALLGAGGERTDLGAHFFGFATGLVAGVLLRTKVAQSVRQSNFLQIVLGILTCSIVWISWIKAFAETI